MSTPKLYVARDNIHVTHHSSRSGSCVEPSDREGGSLTFTHIYHNQQVLAARARSSHASVGFLEAIPAFEREGACACLCTFTEGTEIQPPELPAPYSSSQHRMLCMYSARTPVQAGITTGNLIPVHFCLSQLKISGPSRVAAVSLVSVTLNRVHDYVALVPIIVDCIR